MPDSTVEFSSKLPRTGTSIFAVMSALANETGAINLSQGFPNFPVSGELIGLVEKYMRAGFNQYAPMPGVQALREAIAAKVEKTFGMIYDPAAEITITAGATEAIYAIAASMIRPGDEAVVIEPAYDSYAPAVELNGGKVRYSRMTTPGYRVNWPEVESLISGRTRLIFVNSPHNPTGAVLSASDMQELDRITRNTNVVILSDEVYEHLIFDDLLHESICLYPSLAQRSFVVGSFGKTFHATGWKIGFVLAPSTLMAEFRKAHQFIVFAGNTPMQHAMAEYLGNPEHYLSLPSFYQQKRDLFLDRIKGSRFRVVPCHGTYFQLLDYSDISDENERDFAIRITREYGVASVPVSPFYHDEFNNLVLRFCFAKTEETLTQAADILCRI